MNLRRAPILTITGLALLALGLTACGGGNSDNGSTSAPSAGTGRQTVATKSMPGLGEVLVDSKGQALYTNDMDTPSKIACSGQCLTEWVPLAAPSGGQPRSNDAAVQAKLGMTKRSDGSTQVTFDDLPLYTFAEDSPGQVTGNGFTDSFGGTTFTWTVGSAGGSSTGSSSGGGTTTSGGDGYGGGY